MLIARNGNHSLECTDKIHPEVAHACKLAARIVGLDIAGIDLVCEDIGRPLIDQGGAIVEVNAGPSLLMHLNPAQGEPRPVGKAIVDHLFPDNDTGRIPIVGVTGTRDNAQIAQLVAWLMQLSGMQVGLSCSDGLFVGPRRLETYDASDWETGQRLLINRNVEAAVFENSPQMIVAEGLAYDRCDIGIVTDADAIATMVEYDTDKQRYKVLRTQVDVVRPEGAAVLNAEDALVLDMASLSDGEVLLYAEDSNNAALQKLRETGGRVVFMNGTTIVQAHGAQTINVLDISKDLRPAARNLPVPVLLASVAAAWALGLEPDMVATGLETFEPAPSRVRSL